MLRKIEMQSVSRRDLLKFSGSGVAATAALTLLPNLAFADAKSAAALINKITSGKNPADGKITLEVPQIAENGNTVPVGFDVASPMTDADYVKTVHLLADGNPNPEVASFSFTTASGKAKASTRMRMAKTQNVIVVAEMSNGSFFMAKSEVKVTIGGCGG